ncbi:ABC transporter ATP-binding protein [Caulobacter sp. DWP3-1-3b2]|uniref:ABC transporter ATP-binding protein n=1 Tax=Caulobacter sp. DWP3-1-3b2 TaxID=2804643 RepID=UPI003CF60AD5
MSPSLVSLERVGLVYPIYSIRAQSLRHAAINLAVGGRLLKGSNDVVHVSALNNVSFRLHEGDRLGLVGHNGSGKTTLLKVLAGVYEPSEGKIDVRGQVSSMLDIGHGVDWEATGVDNIKIMSRLRGLRGREIRERMDDIINFSELGGYADLPMKSYSAGMSARLMFTLATSFTSDVLILDEWLGAGDAAFLHKVAERMTSLVSQARVLVLASHNFALLDSTCNKILVLDKGQVAFFGPKEDLPDELRPV